MSLFCFFFFSSRRRHTRSDRDWSSDVCSSDLVAGEVEQPVAAQYLVGIVDEGGEQIELAGGEPHLAAVGRYQLARGEVEVPTGEAGAGTRPARLLLLCPARGAPKHTLDARQQLAQVKGLGEVVVGPHLQADDAIDRLAAPGQYDDADSRVLAQLSRQG